MRGIHLSISRMPAMGRAGFTLVEMVVTMGLAGIILLGVATFMAESSKNMVQDARSKSRDTIVESVRRYAFDTNALRTSAGMVADASGTITTNVVRADGALPPHLQSTNIAADSPGNKQLQICMAGAVPAVAPPNCVGVTGDPLCCQANVWIDFDLYEPVFNPTTNVATSWIRTGGMDEAAASTSHPQLYRRDGSRCDERLAAPTADCRFQVVTKFKALCRENDPTSTDISPQCPAFTKIDPTDPLPSYGVENIQVQFSVREVAAAGGLAFSATNADSSLSAVDSAQRLTVTAGIEENTAVQGCALRGEICRGITRSVAGGGGGGGCTDGDVDTGTQACSGGRIAGPETRFRTCVGGAWDVWSAWVDAACLCPVGGESWNGTACVAGVCIGAAPGASDLCSNIVGVPPLGAATRTVTCTPPNWITGGWNTAACSCPVSTTWDGSACVAAACTDGDIDSGSRACSGGRVGAGETRSRTCSGGTWGGWTGWNDGACSCPVVGETWDGSACVAPACVESTVDTDSQPCSGGRINGPDTRTRTCTGGAWGAWTAWTNLCTCPVAGDYWNGSVCGPIPACSDGDTDNDTPRACTGGRTGGPDTRSRTCSGGNWGAWSDWTDLCTCSVPGETWNGSACEAATCPLAGKPIDTDSCANRAGARTQGGPATRSVTCPVAPIWVSGAWDISTCSCPSGTTWNGMTSMCELVGCVGVAQTTTQDCSLIPTVPPVGTASNTEVCVASAWVPGVWDTSACHCPNVTDAWSSLNTCVPKPGPVACDAPYVGNKIPVSNWTDPVWNISSYDTTQCACPDGTFFDGTNCSPIVLNFSPAPVDFGLISGSIMCVPTDTFPGCSGFALQWMTVTNAGTVVAPIGSVFMIDDFQLTIVTDNCIGKSLAPGDSCTIQVKLENVQGEDCSTPHNGRVQINSGGSNFWGDVTGTSNWGQPC